MWLRWRHNDITNRNTMVNLVGVSFEIIVLTHAVSEILSVIPESIYMLAVSHFITTSGFRPPCWTQDDPIADDVRRWLECVRHGRKPLFPFWNRISMLSVIWLITTSGFRPPCWTRDDPIVGMCRHDRNMLAAVGNPQLRFRVIVLSSLVSEIIFWWLPGRNRRSRDHDDVTTT